MASQHFCHFLKNRGQKKSLSRKEVSSLRSHNNTSFQKNRLRGDGFSYTKNRKSVRSYSSDPFLSAAIFAAMMGGSRPASTAWYSDTRTTHTTQESAPTSSPSARTAEWWETLKVSQHASGDEIKSAYRNMAKETHPDVAPHGSNEKFQAVNEAYKQGMGGVENL